MTFSVECDAGGGACPDDFTNRLWKRIHGFVDVDHEKTLNVVFKCFASVV